MFPERWLELAAGLAVVATTGAWVGRGWGRRRAVRTWVGVWGVFWVGGWAASYWFLRRAASALDEAVPEERLTQFAGHLEISLNLLTAARLVLIAGFLILAVIRLRRAPQAESQAGASAGTPPANDGDGDG